MNVEKALNIHKGGLKLNEFSSCINLSRFLVNNSCISTDEMIAIYH